MNKILATAALLALAAPLAHAQSMKPGLWEITNKTQSAGGSMDSQMADMQKQMAGMSPEQRKMIEDVMARQGMKMGKGPGGGMSVKMCMTPEMVARNQMPQQRSDCKTTQQSKSGNTMKMAFTCTNPPSSGDGEITYPSNESYTMKMNVTTQIEGETQKMRMEGTGKWLGANCGDVKPVPAK